MITTLALIFALAAPAGAEKPPKVQASATFPDVNACTGEDELITLSWTITVHENRRNSVATFKTVVETTSGFYGTGTETQVITGEKQLNTFNIRITNGEQVATVKGHRRIDLAAGEIVTNNFRSTCVRA
ncbi:MAG: hypothetical protein EX269_00315 [Acidimicrobiales bacterium]|nr:MAG: hypothetical protein EX269_00315 [Acidimicrobiales bacterium]